MQENEDLGFFVPEEGSNIYFDSIVITATSSKKEMAEQFIDFLLEPEVAAKNIEFIGYSSANTKVLDILGDEWANNTAYTVPDAAAGTDSNAAAVSAAVCTANEDKNI